MKVNIINRTLASLLLVGICISCDKNDWNDVPQASEYFAIEGEIVDANVATTRSKTKAIGSHTGFEIGDQVGFYSFHENRCDRGLKKDHEADGDDTDYLQNECLTYSNASGVNRFESQTLTDITLSTLGVTFAYFPYSDAARPEGYVKYDEKEKDYVPLEAIDHYVHIFDENNQVVDLLAATKRQYFNVNYQFRHHFSMVLIFLGDGFKPDDNAELSVHLTEQIIGAHVTRKWHEHSENELFPFTIDRVPLNHSGIQGKSSFTAKKVPGYKVPGTDEARTVYPVVLPFGTKIDYIKVTDINGKEQKVKATDIKELESGWMYPMTVRMNSGLLPTIYPHEIIPWGEPEEIRIDRLPGIYTTDDFVDWLEVYNKNVENFPTVHEGDLDKLDKYGEYTEEDGWTFYIRDSIDCANIPTGNGYLISKLKDRVTIDGGRHKVKNLMLDLKDTEPVEGGIGFIREISGGVLRNLRLEFPTVKYNGNSAPAGCIAAEISDGQITNCTVLQAAMVCKKEAGTLAGRMTGGLVYDCKFHGTVKAVRVQEVEDDYLGVVGSYTEGVIFMSPIINHVRFVPAPQD